MTVQRSCGDVASRAWCWVRNNYWELPASILECATLVLVVFFQDIAFKEVIVVSAALLTVSFWLHGLAYRAGQSQKWPKVIEVVAPVLFYALIPPAYLATYITYRTVFITINFWFVFWQMVVWLGLGINIMEEYLQDWNPREVWGTPLLKHCSKAVAISWIICESIMGSTQIFVVIFNISIDTNQVAAILLCHVMQLIPLLWAVIFTFAYPAYIKRRWGYQYGVRSICFPPAAESNNSNGNDNKDSSAAVTGLLDGTLAGDAALGGSQTGSAGSINSLDVGLLVTIDSESGMRKLGSQVELLGND